MRYYLIVGEASGDLHASNLMKALKEVDSEAQFRFFGGDLMTDAFGEVALVALTPLIAIQTMGLVYKFKANKIQKRFARHAGLSPDSDVIIDLE